MIRKIKLSKLSKLRNFQKYSVSRMESRLSSGHESGTSLNSSHNSQDPGEVRTVNIHEIDDDEEVTETRLKPEFKSGDECRPEVNEDFMVPEVTKIVESAGKLKSPPGEDSIHENLVALDNRDLNFSIRTSEIEDDMQRSSALFAELPPKPELDFTPDNVPIQRKPVSSGFLVSFLVDARGGSLSCSRHSGLRLIVPPGAASGPVRVICRMLRQDKVPRPPNLNDGEGLACRIMEMGPNHIKFNGPILLEVPHYAAIRGREREVIVFRSDNGDVWKEHNVACNDQVISDTFGHGFDKLESCDELAQKRIIRILTSDFPQYFALISRVRQDSGVVGPDGGVLSSTVVPQVQAVFPENALMKRTRVGLQAQTISTDLVSKLVGNRVAVSPIVTIEPRRRQFHKPITLTIPSPQAVSKGMINPPADGKEFNLRLLCSITGGYSPATWEDITGSMPLSVVKDCVSFTTKLSARFWLIHCQNVQEVTEMGGLLYREASLVPYVGKFVMFCRRHDPEEAQLRAFCITDDKVDKTLECHEGFELKAASPEVEVLHNRPVWLETAGNLIPVTKTGQQLQLPFTAFTENRLSFLIRVKDPHQDPVGKIAFMKDSRGVTAAGSGSPGDVGAQKPLCTLEVRLPDQICTTGRSELRSSGDQSRMISSSDLESWKIMVIETETIAKTELDLREVAEALGCDWSLLARELDVPQSDITQLKLDYRTDLERAFAMLILWRKKQEDQATGNALERGLRRIGREDVVKICMRNIEYVTTEDERAEANARMSMPSLTSDTHDDQKEINENDGTSTPIELETLVAEIDSRRGVIQAPHSDEENETSQARTEAYLKLIDQLEATLPSEEEILAKAGLDDKDYQDGGEVEEESVAAQQRETAPASDLSPLLEKISTKPAFAMAPEGEKEEEEEEEEENGVIRPTKMKADPVAEVAFDPTRLEKDQPKLDFDSGVEEEPLSLKRQRGLHSAPPPRSDSEEKTPEPEDEESLSPFKQRGLHSAAPPMRRARRDSLSSESSNEEDFVDAEEKRGVSQEPELILDRGMKRGSTEDSDRFGMETSDLELSMYGPSDATSMTMTVSGISRITPPRSSGVQSDDPDDHEFDTRRLSRTSSSSSSVGDVERSKTPTGETPQLKTDPSSEDEEMAFQRAYEAAVKYGSGSDDPEVDHKHHDVKETHQIIYGKPEERSQVEEIEEELEDGTIIKRKIVRKQVIQKVTDRIIREGCPEALAAQAAKDEAAFTEESEGFGGKGAPKTTVEVEEFEETLPDGSVVQRRVEHTTVAEEVTIGDETPGETSFSDNLHPVNDPEVVQEVREELPDGSVVIKRIVRQTHCHEQDEGAEVAETTTLDEGPFEEHEK